MHREKEQTLYLTYYDYDDFLRSIGKILENKKFWDELEDDRSRLDKVEIVIQNLRRLGVPKR